MKIQLSDHFTARRLIRFVVPSVIMMVFTSIYGVVDGYFVSNYAGKTAFAAVNLIMPFLMIVGTLGFMIGTGGTALVSKTMGEGNPDRANKLFSMLVYAVIIFGAAIAALGEIFLPGISLLLGADDAMLPYCVAYGRILLLSVTFFMLQNVFQSFLVAAEKPNLGLAITVAAGVTNMILDFLFVGAFKWGVVGAGAATAVAETMGGVIPLIYFLAPNKSTLRLGKPVVDPRAFLKTCTNGVSELMSNVSMSLISMLYNYQLIKYFGEDGIAAYGVIMYVNFVFISIFIGYSIGVAPIVGFNYGAKNRDELNNILRKSLIFIAAAGTVMFIAAQLLARPLSAVFAGYDPGLRELTRTAFMIFSTSCFFKGFNIFSSSFFTALNNGLISAIISFSRTLFFQVICIYLLPALFGRNAIWISVTVAEILTLAVSVIFLVAQNKKYGYFKKKDPNNA